MNKKIYLNEEFDKFFNKLKNNENFALVRNGDGERAVMRGKAVLAQEGWTAPDFVTKLGEDIYNSLSIDDDSFYYGISCPCCDNESYYWYSSRIPSKNRTFANLWVNKNYRRFKENFESIKRDAVLIANFRAENHKIGNLNTLKHYKISDDCVEFWKNDAGEMISQIKEEFGKRNDLLYIVSAGPMSTPIIAELWKNNPNNCYIDFGSATDIYYRDVFTRPYMQEGTIYAERNCWMDDPKTTDFNVSVVLDLYKRLEALPIQLEAIENQTLKPKEILLYQDGTGDSIKIPDDIKDKFNIVEISPENKGVWERFKFAEKNAASKYVCIFDDDTIPGRRWLENCHTEMMKENGLYGTIGIVMNDIHNYPVDNYYRVGWDGPIDRTTEVDFVGHSWFLEKEWLKYLFDAPEELQKLKLAGEDMCLSFELQKKGIKTFVPPHPANNLEMYGSIPNYAWYFGLKDVAISMTYNNMEMMRSVVNILDELGWKTLSKRK